MLEFLPAKIEARKILAKAICIVAAGFFSCGSLQIVCVRLEINCCSRRKLLLLFQAELCQSNQESLVYLRQHLVNSLHLMHCWILRLPLGTKELYFGRNLSKTNLPPGASVAIRITEAFRSRKFLGQEAVLDSAKLRYSTLASVFIVTCSPSR